MPPRPRPKPKSKPKSSEIIDDSDLGSDIDPATPPPKPSNQAKGRAKKSTMDDDLLSSLRKPSKKATPSKSPVKNPSEVVEITSDSEEDAFPLSKNLKKLKAKKAVKSVVDEVEEITDSDQPPPTPSPKKKDRKQNASSVSAVTFSPTKIAIRRHPLDKKPVASPPSDNGEEEEEEEEEDELEGDDCEFEGDDDVVALDKDDSMYPEPSSPSRVQIASQPVPITPPLVTRSKGADKRTRSSPGEESPTKRTRNERTTVQNRSADDPKASVPGVDGAKPYTRKTGAVFPADNQSDESDFFSDGDKPVANASALNKDQPVLSDTDPILRAVGQRPSVCEVTEMTISQLDPVLKCKGFYDNLPLLRHVNFTPVRPSEGRGLVVFSSWNGVLDPGFNSKRAAESIRFVRDGRFINLPRIDPHDLVYVARHPPGGGSAIWEICVETQPAICLSSLMCSESYLESFNDKLLANPLFSSTPYHYLSGVFHTHEFSRMVAVLGAITQHDQLEANLWEDGIRFATKTGGSGNKPRRPVANPWSVMNIPGLFDSSSSPSKPSVPTSDVPISRRRIRILEAGKTIPVYDVRGIKFEYNANTFDRLDELFPKWKGEIPFGSFIVVASITQVHQFGGKAGEPVTHRFFMYPLFALLYGVPKASVV